MFAIAGPALAVAVPITVTVLVSAAAAQGFIPVVDKVSVATPLKLGGGVHVAFKVVASRLKVPPVGVLQIPPVALAPTDPPRPVVVPP